MTTMFIAIQCCGCLTMQVKQQKKSSNKWACVVCNQKQSVRKIYAQAYVAKEVRKFVQSFNMSRKFEEEGSANQAESQFIIKNQISVGEDDNQQQRKKKRTDWSEYVENEDADHLKLKPNFEESGENEGIETRIVTEFPDELFKKPKPRNYCCAGFGNSNSLRGTSSNYYKPQFPKRNKCSSFQGSGTKSNVERQHEQQQLLLPNKSPPTAARKNGVPSKWDKYLTAEVEDEEDNYKNQPVAFADHLRSLGHRNPKV